MSKVIQKTKRFALLGNPLEHSLSPQMYNAAFAAENLDCHYLTLQIEKEQLQETVEGFQKEGIAGGNVTYPFKEAIVPFMDELTTEASLSGAVNTFYWSEDRLWGDNTDGAGFIVALKQAEFKFSPYKSVLILGAGGAARAMSVALALVGIKNFTIINRSRERAEDLATLLEKLGAIVSIRSWQSSGLKDAFSENKLVVNTTPLGMLSLKEEGPPVQEKWFAKGQLVVDLIYRPQETLFLQKARARGCRTLNGLSTLWAQGVLAFERWAGQKAPAEVMWQELKRWV